MTKLKAVRDLVLRQHDLLEDFAAEFVQQIKGYPQFSNVARQDNEWKDFTALAFNAQKKRDRLEGSLRTMKRFWSAGEGDTLMTDVQLMQALGHTM